MSSVEDNRITWNEAYDWRDRGDEWSAAWGGPAAQWHESILPRIRACVPAGAILEIGPGFGRWTQYLKDLCRTLFLIDLSPRCIEACRRRFSSEPHMSYHVNDGRSLKPLRRRSIDFAFSFDSLVHAEADVMDAYLRELRRTLQRTGAAFIHHSNFGGVRADNPGVVNEHQLAESVSAETFRTSCERHGLHCLSQEIVNWGSDAFSDVFSLVTPAGRSPVPATRIVQNGDFMVEAERIKQRASERAARSSEPPAVELQTSNCKL